MKYIKLNAFTLELELSKNELIIYNYILTISDFLGKDKIYISYSQIGYETRINRRSVIRSVQELKKLELIDTKPYKEGIMILVNQEKRKNKNISLFLDNLSQKWTTKKVSK